MTTETVILPDGSNTAAESQVVDGPKSLEEALALIENLKGINKEVISTRDKTNLKLRQFETEQTQREQSLLAEQGQFKELYEKSLADNLTLKTGLKNKAVDSAIKDILSNSGARSVDTVAKLVDKSKIVIGDEDFMVDTTSIQSQIDELRKTDPILFGIGEGANLPPVKRPTDGTPTAGYEQEMRAAKSQKEIESVMKKYGKN